MVTYARFLVGFFCNMALKRRTKKRAAKMFNYIQKSENFLQKLVVPKTEAVILKNAKKKFVFYGRNLISIY